MVVYSFANCLHFRSREEYGYWMLSFFINEALFTIWGKGVSMRSTSREMNNGLRLCLIVHLLLDQEIEHLHTRPFSVCRTVFSQSEEISCQIKRVAWYWNRCFICKRPHVLKFLFLASWLNLPFLSSVSLLWPSWRIKKLPLMIPNCCLKYGKRLGRPKSPFKIPWILLKFAK